MNEEKFRIYLRQVITQLDTKFDEKTIEDMINVLKVRIPSQISNLPNILNLEDLLELEKIKKRFSKGGDLYDYNRNDKNRTT